MIPRKTPCVVVYNTRMPREWYDYFMARAKKHNMTEAREGDRNGRPDCQHAGTSASRPEGG